jgi:hypothetical protein
VRDHHDLGVEGPGTPPPVRTVIPDLGCSRDRPQAAVLARSPRHRPEDATSRPDGRSAPSQIGLVPSEPPRTGRVTVPDSQRFGCARSANRLVSRGAPPARTPHDGGGAMQYGARDFATTDAFVSDAQVRDATRDTCRRGKQATGNGATNSAPTTATLSFRKRTPMSHLSDDGECSSSPVPTRVGGRRMSPHALASVFRSTQARPTQRPNSRSAAAPPWRVAGVMRAFGRLGRPRRAGTGMARAPPTRSTRSTERLAPTEDDVEP